MVWRKETCGILTRGMNNLKIDWSLFSALISSFVADWLKASTGSIIMDFATTTKKEANKPADTRRFLEHKVMNKNSWSSHACDTMPVSSYRCIDQVRAPVRLRVWVCDACSVWTGGQGHTRRLEPLEWTVCGVWPPAPTTTDYFLRPSPLPLPSILRLLYWDTDSIPSLTALGVGSLPFPRVARPQEICFEPRNNIYSL